MSDNTLKSYSFDISFWPTFKWQNLKFKSLIVFFFAKRFKLWLALIFKTEKFSKEVNQILKVFLLKCQKLFDFTFKYMKDINNHSLITMSCNRTFVTPPHVRALSPWMWSPNHLFWCYVINERLFEIKFYFLNLKTGNSDLCLHL